MLKTIVLGAATLFVAMGVALADNRDLNKDGKIQAWELHEYYSSDGPNS